MQFRPEIFAISVILFVPFAYATFSISDVCAVPPSVKWGLSQDCTGALNKGDGIKTCCWIEKDAKGNEVDRCQACSAHDDGEIYCGPVTFPESLRPGLSGTLDEGGVIEGNTTGSKLTENRLPGGGVFKAPEPNISFSQTDNSSTSSNNTLAQLQSDLEKEEAEESTEESGAEGEQDENGENGNSNEEEDE
jgi:hypothetical protein